MTDEPTIDVAQIFRDFERRFEATARAKGWDAEERRVKRDSAYLAWLENNARLSAAEYRAALNEYDRRRAAEVAAEAERERREAAEQEAAEERSAAAEREGAEGEAARLKALAQDVESELAGLAVGDGKKKAFRAWWRSVAAALTLDAAGRVTLADGTRLGNGREVVNHWFGMNYREREAARRKAEAAAAASARQEAERERERAAVEARRVALLECLADPAWVNGEDPASLRAVAAWLLASRREDEVTFEFESDHAAPGAPGLGKVLEALDQEVAARDRAVERVDAENERTRLARQVTGEPGAPYPPDVDLNWDEDAVARWLTAHAGEYSLRLGRWESEDDRRPVSTEGGGLKLVTVERRVLRGRPEGWDREGSERVGATRQVRWWSKRGSLQTRFARWTVWRRLEAEAAANPGAAEALRATGLDVLLDLPSRVDADVEWQRRLWAFEPPYDDEQDKRASPEGSAVQVVADVTLQIAAVTAFKEFALRKKIVPTRKGISRAMRAAGAKGQDKVLCDAYYEVQHYYDEHGDLPS